jgi:molybdopterin synthase catalytic subunit
LIPNVYLSHKILDVPAIRAAATDPAAGAVVLFEGCARNHHEDRAVELLAYEAYEPMALAELGRLAAEATARFGLLRCLVHHRLGEVPLTEAAVVVACASAHRAEAFQAAAWIMDAIKVRVPVWKRERYEAGPEAWVEGVTRH